MNPIKDLKEPRGKSEETKVLVQSREREREREEKKKREDGREKRDIGF